MAAPWRGGSWPADGGSPSAPAGGDQPRRENWSLLQPILMVGSAYSYSTTVSTSGTVSTTYTSSRGSAAVSYSHAAERLLKEISHGDGDIVGALERCLSEIGLDWVLRLSNNASTGTTTLLPDDQSNLSKKRCLWIWALTDIMDSIHTSHWMLDRQGIPSVIPNFLLARLIEETVVKMLPFVDVLLADADLDATTATITDGGAQVVSESGKLQPLLDVRDALSSASEIIGLFDWESSEEMEAIQRSDNALSLLSAKKHKLDEAIWNTVEEVRTRILAPPDNEWGIQTPQGSSDIAKVIWSLIDYIKSLWNNYELLDKIVCKAAELGRYIPNPDISSSLLLVEQHKTDPFTTLILEMVSSLEVKLAKRSESFPDHSLRFLFLINNTNFICQQLHQLFGMEFHLTVLTLKIQDYIQKYLQVSWAPVLSCLNNQTPRWFGTKTNSALPKFDSKFQKTYDKQKFWKVPDPQLRRRLRKAIIERVVPAFTKYLKDNKITKPGVTPKEREMMLWEIFEG